MCCLHSLPKRRLMRSPPRHPTPSSLFSSGSSLTVSPRLTPTATGSTSVSPSAWPRRCSKPSTASTRTVNPRSSEQNRTPFHPVCTSTLTSSLLRSTSASPRLWQTRLQATTDLPSATESLSLATTLTRRWARSLTAVCATRPTLPWPALPDTTVTRTTVCYILWQQ